MKVALESLANNLTDSLPNKKERQQEYEYKVEALAVETFTNLMRFEGVSMPWGGPVTGSWSSRATSC